MTGVLLVLAIGTNASRQAYLHLVNSGMAALERGAGPEAAALHMLDLLRRKYRGTLILVGGFDYESAEAWSGQGGADLIAFDRKFFANPDLPERFRLRAPLNASDPATFYGGGVKGYSGYPTLAQESGMEPMAAVDDRWR